MAFSAANQDTERARSATKRHQQPPIEGSGGLTGSAKPFAFRNASKRHWALHAFVVCISTTLEELTALAPVRTQTTEPVVHKFALVSRAVRPAEHAEAIRQVIACEESVVSTSRGILMSCTAVKPAIDPAPTVAGICIDEQCELGRAVGMKARALSIWLPSLVESADIVRIGGQ